MSVPAEVAGDIHPQVPGAADSLQHLSMQYILRLERVPGGCHPHDLALGGVNIALDKAAYCVFTQFRERENAIKFISVRTKTQ